MFVFSKVDEMFGFLPEEKTPAIVSAPTAFKVRRVIITHTIVYYTTLMCYFVTLCLEFFFYFRLDFRFILISLGGLCGRFSIVFELGLLELNQFADEMCLQLQFESSRS